MTIEKFNPNNPLPTNIVNVIKASAKIFNDADRADTRLKTTVSNIAKLMYDRGITSDMLKNGGNGSKANPFTLIKSTTRDALILTFHPKAQALLNLDRKTAEKVLRGKVSDPVSKTGLTMTKADRDRQNSNLSSRFFKIVKSIEGYEAGGDGTNQGANSASKGKKTVISKANATCTVQAKTVDQKILITLITVQKLVQNKDSAKWSIEDFQEHLDKLIEIVSNKK